jgi:hypothetical protein
MAVPDSAVLGGAGIAVPVSTVTGGGGMKEPASAVVGGGGIAVPVSTVIGGGGMKDPASAVVGGGGIADPDSAVLGGGGMTDSSSAVVGGGMTDARAPNLIPPWCVFFRRNASSLTGRGQNVRMAISAGAASSPAISSSRRLSVIDTPAMSSDVQ